MNKGTHFNGQPMYGQLISLLDKHEIGSSDKVRGIPTQISTIHDRKRTVCP